jgi:DNA modification methylase
MERSSVSKLKLEIEYCDPAVLLASQRNSRTHPKTQIRQIAESMKRFGMVTPVGVSDDNEIIYGHARVEAAKLAGLEQVPVVRLSHLTPDERRAYLIADNQIALNAGWNRELLAAELKDLEALDFELPALGFSLAEIDTLFEDAHEARTDVEEEPEDDIPVLPEQAVTKPGDIWLLGNHRLICGDSRDPAIYAALLGDERVDLIFTDPPYNVEIDGNVCGSGSIHHREFAMAAGEMSEEQFTQFLVEGLSPAAAACRDGAIAFVCMDWRHIGELTAAGKRVFTELKNVCVWNKKNAGMRTFYRSKHEMVFVFKVGTAPHVNTFGLGDNGRYRTNVWDYAGISSGGAARLADLAMHPTVKPVALIADALKDCSKRGDIVLDNFAGSGSTLIAAQKTGRRARLIEYDPLYCDVIVQRYERFTGKHGTLAAGGTFEEMRSYRMAQE